ncbi:MAG TPA: hypothetical protein VNK43_03145 [Gemmatimonadales bacterium]|nr:hypothetical protein [Gemmatimonadales bacterium]
MTTQIRRVIDMLLRVLMFSRANPSDDPGHATTLSRLEERAARMQALVAQEKSGRIAVRAAVVTKRELRRAIQEALVMLARIAASVTREEPEIVVRLSLPRPHSSQQEFLAGSRVVVTEAEEHREVLVKYGMPPAFLEELSTLLDRYQTAIDEKNAGLAAHVGASADLHSVAAEVRALVKLLDAVNRRRFRNEPEKLAQWRSAKDVVRRARETPAPPADQGPEGGGQGTLESAA